MSSSFKISFIFKDSTSHSTSLHLWDSNSIYFEFSIFASTKLVFASSLSLLTLLISSIFSEYLLLSSSSSHHNSLINSLSQWSSTFDYKLEFSNIKSVISLDVLSLRRQISLSLSIQNCSKVVFKTSNYHFNEAALSESQEISLSLVSSSAFKGASMSFFSLSRIISGSIA